MRTERFRAVQCSLGVRICKSLLVPSPWKRFSVFLKKNTCLLALSACATTQTPLSHKPRAAPAKVQPIQGRSAAHTMPSFRLGTATEPLSYALRLTLDPTSATFRGQVEISINVNKPVRSIWLHSRNLQITEVSAEQAGHRVPMTVDHTKSDSELLGLHSEHLFAVGPARLHLAWSGSFGTMTGLFRQSEHQRRYIYSDFEAIDARAAMPCYDDPRFKTPWTVTLGIPSYDRAFSNTPEVSRESIGPGQSLVRFAKTPPLPSYLLAVAVGPFETISASGEGVPMRVIAPKGSAEQGRFVLRHARAMLQFLEQYLDLAMPFRKLDLIAVPQFGGAMENPGLITFSAGLLLLTPEASAESQRRSLGVLAHEMAHLWFGDLLTPKYWNDLWLSEGFATWLSIKTVNAVQPGRAQQILGIADKSTAFPIDHRLGGPIVRQPIESRDDIRSAFGAITYRKGGAILTMLESWIGEDRMRDSIRDYLQDNLGRSIDTASLLQSLAKRSGDAAGFAPYFESFLEHRGIPLISVTVHCDHDHPPRVTLRQQRYLPILPLQKAKSLQQGPLWTLPICLRYPSAAPTTATAAPHAPKHSSSVRQCTVLRSVTKTLPLRTKSCPEWILPNDNDSGYYHYQLSAQDFAALQPERLNLRESLGFVHNISAALRAGSLNAEQSLKLLKPFRMVASPQVQEALIEFLYGVSDSLVSRQERPAFAAMIRRWYRPILRRIGVLPTTSEPTWFSSRRPALLLLLSDLGDDRALQEELVKHVHAWLDLQAQASYQEPTKIPFKLLDAWLRVAAGRKSGTKLGEKKLARRYLKLARTTPSSAYRFLLWSALHAFPDAEILAQTLSAGLHMPNTWHILSRAMHNKDLRPIILANLGASRLSSDQATSLFSSLCDARAMAEIQNYSKDPNSPAIQQLVSSIATCIRFSKVQKPLSSEVFSAKP